MRKVASELGVHYVLEGSVRKASSRVRVTAQLIDANKGVNLWADRYDRDLANIFELQDEITNRVIDSVGSQIIVAEAARVQRKPPQNIEAWDLVMRALPHMWRMSVEEQRLAPRNACATGDHPRSGICSRARAAWLDLSMHVQPDARMPIGEFTDKALESGERAVALDDQDHWGHFVLGPGTLATAASRTGGDASFQIRRSKPPTLRSATRARLRLCMRRAARTRIAIAGAGAAAKSRAIRFFTIYAPIVRYMALFALGQYEETDCGMPLSHGAASAPRRRLAADDGLTGIARKRSTRRGSAPHVRSPLQPDLSSAHVVHDTVFVNPNDRARFLWDCRTPD